MQSQRQLDAKAEPPSFDWGDTYPPLIFILLVRHRPVVTCEVHCTLYLSLIVPLSFDWGDTHPPLIFILLVRLGTPRYHCAVLFLSCS
jgi:hypothetical protein